MTCPTVPRPGSPLGEMAASAIYSTDEISQEAPMRASRRWAMGITQCAYYKVTVK